MSDVVTSHPKARKAHNCEVCGPSIKPGDTYTRVAIFDGGDAFTWKNCSDCDDPISQARSDDYVGDDGITGDDVREWAQEHRGLYDAANGVLHRIRTNNPESETP